MRSARPPMPSKPSGTDAVNGTSHRSRKNLKLQVVQGGGTMRKRRTALPTLVLLWAAVLLVAIGSGSPAGAGPSDSATNDQRDDLEILAESLEIPISDLEDQVALQDAMDGLDFQEIDPGYAEYGSRLGADFQVWYRSANEPSAELISAVEAVGAVDVRFEQVPLSHNDLLDKATRVYDVLVEQGNPVGVTIDTAAGGVVLHPPSDPSSITPEDREDAERLASIEGLTHTWGEPPPEPTG